MNQRTSSSRRVLLLGFIALAFLPFAAVAQTMYEGQTESGAYYRIAVPDGWTPAGGLVIWNHGFDLDLPEPGPDLGPLVDIQLAEGYAVAASSYSLNGWALFQTLDDNQQLYEAFVDEVGVPDQVIVSGGSLGGIVTAQAIEGGGVGNVVGALPICGAVAGSRVWNGAFDLRLLYDQICGEVPGGAIPGGANGLPFPLPDGLDENALGFAINTCTGILLPPAARTADQQERLDTLLEVSGLPENFILTDMGFATFGLADLIYDPRKMAGANPFNNSNVDYGDDAINEGIERVSGDAEALDRFLEYYTPTGDVGDTKIVSIHTSGDGLVIVENQSEYASVVPRRNLTVGVVEEDVPTHCGFTVAETVAAWESLRGWIAGLPQPTVADLQGACDALVAGGLATGPCRYAPGFEVEDMDDRVRLREACVPGASTMCLNDERFKVEVNWSTAEDDGDGMVSPLRTDDTGSFWFFGPQNIDLMVKVLDGLQINGNYWVFYGSLSDVAFEITVTDTDNGRVRTYTNSLGEFASRGDTEAF